MDASSVDALLGGAVARDSLPDARCWIQKGGSLKQRVQEGFLLTCAIRNENPDMVRLLLDSGAPIKHFPFHPVEPIETAVRAFNPQTAAEMVFDLVYAGCTVTGDDLCHAARMGNAACLWILAQLSDELPVGVLFNAILSECQPTIALAESLGGKLSIAEELVINCWCVETRTNGVKSLTQPYDFYFKTKKSRDWLLTAPGRIKPYWTTWAHHIWPKRDKLAIETFLLAMQRQHNSFEVPFELQLCICSFFVLVGGGSNWPPVDG